MLWNGNGGKARQIQCENLGKCSVETAEKRAKCNVKMAERRAKYSVKTAEKAVEKIKPATFVKHGTSTVSKCTQEGNSHLRTSS